METSPADITEIIEKNVKALIERKKQYLQQQRLTERVLGKIASFVGSIRSFYVHILVFGGWILWNIGLIGLKPFDPSFIILATFAAVEAIFLTMIVLIGQKHMNAQAEKWAELGLQVSLLSELEVTRILTLVTAMAKKMDIEVAADKEIEVLSKDIQPEKVLDAMEKVSLTPEP